MGLRRHVLGLRHARAGRQRRRANSPAKNLAPLAKVNVESLKEYDYFTYATADGKKAELTDPLPGYWLDYKDEVLTLTFHAAVQDAGEGEAAEDRHFRSQYFRRPLTDPAPGYWLDDKDSILTLHFTLPFKTPVKAKLLRVEIYDPTIFVDFEFAKDKPVKLAGAPSGCKLDVVLPHDISIAQSQKLGEAFFNQLSAAQNWGAQFANKILVNCP